MQTTSAVESRKDWSVVCTSCIADGLEIRVGRLFLLPGSPGSRSPCLRKRSANVLVISLPQPQATGQLCGRHSARARVEFSEHCCVHGRKLEVRFMQDSSACRLSHSFHAAPSPVLALHSSSPSPTPGGERGARSRSFAPSENPRPMPSRGRALGRASATLNPPGPNAAQGRRSISCPPRHGLPVSASSCESEVCLFGTCRELAHAVVSSSRNEDTITHRFADH